MKGIDAIHRGDVFYIYQLDEVGNRIGSRPGIVVSADSVCKVSNLLTVVFITRKTNANSPCHVVLKEADSNQLDGAIVVAAQTHTIRHCQIGDYITTLSSKSMRDIDAAMFIGLGLVPVSENTKQLECFLKTWLDQYQIEPMIDPSDVYDNEVDAKIDSMRAQAHLDTVSDDDSGFTQDDMMSDDSAVMFQGVPEYIHRAAQDEILVACTERDVYKNLYHRLLSVVVDKNNANIERI